ncbi:MAG: DUF3565 domain-containing protein [Nitrospirales bacterium]
MNQAIIGYHQDDEEHWVADLACGHGQHVRHNPPLSQRPWVLTPQGRAKFLGTFLNCKKCEESSSEPVTDNVRSTNPVISFPPRL